MLKSLPPRRTRRVVGNVVLFALGTIIAGGVYAANTKDAEHADRYGFKLDLGINGRPARLHATACMKPGQYYETVQGGIDPLPPWHARFTIVPATEGQLEVQAEISGGSADKPASPRLRMLPGQTGTIEMGRKVMGADGKVAEDHTIRAEITPSIGC